MEQRWRLDSNIGTYTDTEIPCTKIIRIRIQGWDKEFLSVSEQQYSQRL